MAKLLRRALGSGAPPSMARLPMTPEEVAASYGAQEAGRNPGRLKRPMSPRRAESEPSAVASSLLLIV